MDENELWAAIDAQRVRTADLLSTLTPAQWSHNSLCEGWTVRDVAAHLTLQQLRFRDVLRLAVKHPGALNPNRMTSVSARERAAQPTEQLIEQIRAMVGSRRHNIGVTPRETLIDIVVHSQDIAIPLGRSLPVPPEVAADAASRVWDSRDTRMAKVFKPVPYDSLRLIADDIDWTVGNGLEVHGPILFLLLILTGRPAALPHLTGPGTDVLRDAGPSSTG